MDNYNYDDNDDTRKTEAQSQSDPSGQPPIEPSMNPPQYNGYQQNYYQQNGQQFMYQMPTRKKDGLAIASLIFGILALLAGMTVWFGIIFAVVSIVCAIISKINYGYWDAKAVAGLSLGISGLVLALLMFFMVLNMLQNPEFVEQMNEIMQQYEQQYQQFQ